MMFAQGEIWTVDLNPTIGSEQSGLRPCVILQTNAANNHGRTTLIAPFTSKNTDKVYPYECLVTPNAANGLIAVSKIKLDQVRVIDAQRLRNHIGHLEEVVLDKMFACLGNIFDLRGDFR